MFRSFNFRAHSERFDKMISMLQMLQPQESVSPDDQTARISIIHTICLLSPVLSMLLLGTVHIRTSGTEVTAEAPIHRRSNRINEVYVLRRFTFTMRSFTLPHCTMLLFTLAPGTNVGSDLRGKKRHRMSHRIMVIVCAECALCFTHAYHIAAQWFLALAADPYTYTSAI